MLVVKLRDDKLLASPRTSLKSPASIETSLFPNNKALNPPITLIPNFLLINLNILQLEADSVKRSMNQSFNYNATEADLNVNPIKQELRVNQNKKMVDEIAATIMLQEYLANR